MSDVIVIGGGVSGLVAATYLARAGKQVTLFEAQDRLGGLCAKMLFGEGFSAPFAGQTLYALDPRIVADLKLARHGLKFAVRDMPLVGLDGDGKHAVLQRDVHTTAANIAIHSVADAHAWPRFRRELFDLARALRPLWRGENSILKDDVRQRMARLSKTGTAAWLDSWFESDVLKAALCFDATVGGLSPLEPNSALTLVWRAAQEMSGLQGAVAEVTGSTLVDSLVAAAQAAGVAFRTDARVVALLSDGETVTGIRIENNETHTAPHVVCSLPRDEVSQTMMPPLASGIAQAGRSVANAVRIGQSRLLLAFREPPQLGGSGVPGNGRYILAESMTTLVNADLAARAGRLADDLPMEIVIPSVNDNATAPDGHIVSVLIRPVPHDPLGGWQSLRPKLVERVVQIFERFAPGAAAKIVAAKLFTPDTNIIYQASTNVEHLLAGYDSRIKSPWHGLLFCGGDAEPAPAVSGRAARLAAAMLTVRK